MTDSVLSVHDLRVRIGHRQIIRDVGFDRVVVSRLHVHATNREAAAQVVTRQGLKPILIKLEGQESSEGRKGLLKFGGKVKARDLVIFTRQLSTMVSAGVPLMHAVTHSK